MRASQYVYAYVSVAAHVPLMHERDDAAEAARPSRSAAMSRSGMADGTSVAKVLSGAAWRPLLGDQAPRQGDERAGVAGPATARGRQGEHPPRLQRRRR